MAAIKPVSSGLLDMQHINLNADSATALTSPTTELVFATPKAGSSNDEFVSNFKSLAEELEKEETCHSITWGASRENPDTLAMVLGWDTVKVRYYPIATVVLK